MPTPTIITHIVHLHIVTVMVIIAHTTAQAAHTPQAGTHPPTMTPITLMVVRSTIVGTTKSILRNKPIFNLQSLIHPHLWQVVQALFHLA